jgi:hypothetical protein
MARVLKDDHTGRMWDAVLAYPGGTYTDPGSSAPVLYALQP